MWDEPAEVEKKRTRSSKPVQVGSKKGQYIPHFMKGLESKESAINQKPPIQSKSKQTKNQNPIDD